MSTSSVMRLANDEWQCVYGFLRSGEISGTCRRLWELLRDRDVTVDGSYRKLSRRLHVVRPRLQRLTLDCMKGAGFRALKALRGQTFARLDELTIAGEMSDRNHIVGLRHLFAAAPVLRTAAIELDFTEAIDAAEEFVSAFDALSPELRELTLTLLLPTHFCSTYVPDWLPTSKLRRLNVEYTGCDDRLEPARVLAAQLPELECLNVTMNSDEDDGPLTFELVDELALVLTEAPHLRQLRLSLDVQFIETDNEAIQCLAREATHLTHLHLAVPGVPEEILRAVLGCMPGLDVLELKVGTPEDAEQESDKFVGLPIPTIPPKQFAIHLGDRCQSTTFQPLLRAVQDNAAWGRTLTKLGIGVVGAPLCLPDLSTAMRGLGALQECTLLLANTNLVDADVVGLTAALASCSALRELTLDLSNCVGSERYRNDISGAAIMAVLHGLPQLRSLVLHVDDASNALDLRPPASLCVLSLSLLASTLQPTASALQALRNDPAWKSAPSGAIETYSHRCRTWRIKVTRLSGVIAADTAP